MISSLAALLAALPATLRRSVSFDNGAEFVRHRELHALGVETFCCGPHAPWQKGGVENAIGRLRRFLPRSTDLAALPARALNGLLLAVNNTPAGASATSPQPKCSRPNCPACNANPHSCLRRNDGKWGFGALANQANGLLRVERGFWRGCGFGGGRPPSPLRGQPPCVGGLFRREAPDKGVNWESVAER